ncbi:X-Pro dipeptidyl-peptidase domain protein [Catenulispora acidiphila DSM 44928]|uniref:X-Pro dipeptidyl-peptidase domain protein n=1 Tax=Catenulispora acidiphila (strain DSM 44928 / JCM 14897 / NBRC 102108 / NRRL B-24433 / ID139908) TaxID=479433 RepID=C7Q4U2_CATAD|nr:CocE/NonD family hydrolase [Catenulispora acidiphila]ACU73890.1 X-Pro dipeptidyl-peptidase domain protein [Catenulispora acidiphila DSM 44928]
MVFDIRVESGLEATMRDGTILRADAYRPMGSGPWPVLLVRTPYDKQNAEVLSRLDPQGAAGRGYLVIVQDCRGRFASDGVWEPLLHDGPDGYDTIVWAASLPASNGRVGTYGPSYLGYTQQAARAAQPPGLCASVPAFTWSDPNDGLMARGGAYELGLMTHWTLSLGFDVLARRYADAPQELASRLAALNGALEDFRSRVVWDSPAEDLPVLRRLGLTTPKPTSAPHQRSAAIPTLTIAGWFDCFLQGSLDNHVAATASGAPTALIVGPWTHDDQSSQGGASLNARELDFLDRHLRPDSSVQAPESPESPESPVQVFVMGTDEWRRFPSWPSQSTESSWYLHPDACLAPLLPPNSPPDSFDHDPDDPVPTLGGAILLGPDFPSGQCDQAQIEERDDVLIYTSEPMKTSLEVIGRVRVELFATSTAPSTDWIARLCDVDEHGVSRNITDGILRAPSAEPQRQPQKHTIDLWSTAHAFLPGHRIRLQITSTCFPRWARNPASSTARQTVHHGNATPSRLILPRTPA